MWEVVHVLVSGIILFIARTIIMADTSVVPSKKFVINLEQPCASMCTNFSGTLLAVVGRKGTVQYVHAISDILCDFFLDPNSYILCK